MPHPDSRIFNACQFYALVCTCCPTQSYKIRLDSDCNCRIAPNTIAQQPNRSVVESQQNFGGKFRLLSTLAHLYNSKWFEYVGDVGVIFGGTPDLGSCETVASSKAESHQNFRGELGLSSALGQKAKQRHHLLFGAHQAICDDMSAAVLRGRHIQQQRVPEGLEQPEGWEHGQH